MSDKKLDTVLWRSDSTGLFFTSNEELFYIQVPGGTPILIGKMGTTDLFHTRKYTWLNIDFDE